ncbi:AAA family ATPase [Devosia sp. J2-20]|uniref:AAA family ATPase n=1 Tax=Devosia sp. J2-20 TaxID=3026161 RepID=UPI00249B3DD3|nr:AAA family ATPase [Devosia sp. J2-20]WDQ99684.1 AAA family ATPase [Devosia sp. J2-20]
MAFRSADTAAIGLAEEFLQRLRSSYEPIPNDDIDVAVHTDWQRVVTPDYIVAAQMLAVALGQHFRSRKELELSTSLIAMPVRDADEGYLFASVLKATLSDGLVTANPRFAPDQRSLIVFVGGGPADYVRMSVVKNAARQCFPILWFYDHLGEAPEAFVTVADLLLERPVITAEIVSRTFLEIFGAAPANLSSISKPDALSAEDFALRIRAGRSAEACVENLVALMPKEPDAPKQLRTLYDAHGYGHAKLWGIELAQDIAMWRLGELSWQEVDHRAVVLTGKPGVGKTTFAGLLAATLSVPLISSSVAEWNGHDHLSGTLKRMRIVFEKAMAEAPCVLLIDEIDGISSREDIGGRYKEYWTQIVNHMLELVSQALATEGIIIVGATNFEDRIDPALTRAGRLEQTITIESPDVQAITMILVDKVGPSFSKNELRPIAECLHGQTGADIERLVRTAKAKARRAGHRFSITDLAEAVRRRSDNLSAPDRRRIAVYRAGQIVVGQILGLQKFGEADPASTSSPLSLCVQFPPFPTEQFCNDVITFHMAGRAAEEIMIGAVSVFGASPDTSDLAIATKLAKALEVRSGLGEFGLVDVEALQMGEGLSTLMIGGVHRRIQAAMARASALILDNEDEMQRLVDRLVGPRSSLVTRKGPALH